MKILAVYGSNFGQAEAVLRRVSKGLAANGHAVSLFKGTALPAGLAVDGYDAIVVAASIIVGHHQRYIRDFVTRHRAILNAKPGAFISVNGSSPESSPVWRDAARRYVAQFQTETGWEPRWTATFAGALRYPRYGFLTRWIVKGISRRQGGPTDTSKEYEFTDWDAVDRFAQTLVAALAAPLHSPANRTQPVTV